MTLLRGVQLLLAAASMTIGADVACAAETRSNPCRLTATEQALVSGVSDERTVRLADGREVRLAGLAGFDGLAGGTDTAAGEAKAALSDLVVGKTLGLTPTGEDRYGRLVAYLAVGAGAPGSVEQRLLAAGHAIVADRVPSGCAAALQASEQLARAAHLGVWADRYYVIREADRPATVSAIRGRFALVEGKVLSVREWGATIYVNFGQRWSDDFTVTIAKRKVRTFMAAGLEPKSLAGHRIRVRGWIDARGGPWIEAVRPEQIEFADRDRNK